MAGKRRKPSLASLVGKKLDGLSASKAMQLIGTIIDMGGDEQSLAALDHAISLLDQFLARSKVSARNACRTHYFRANIWSAKRHSSPDWQAWLWKSEPIDSEVMELRRAVIHPGFAELHPIERAQIYTNLGNILNHAGRFIEAIEYWDRALFSFPKFAMASGNRGTSLAHYADAVYDPGHESVLMLAACHSLAEACAGDAVFDNPDNVVAREHFSKMMTAIWNHYNIPSVAENVDFNNHPMGRGKKERAYRQWCLGNRLFINPLNDVGPIPIAAHDVMTLPSITVGFDDGASPPAVIHYFNIIKQEFCASRYALYEGVTSTGVHFSDRRVLLYNTLDYPAFGVAVERMKMAFRGAYAVLDKIAFLLNAYLNLGHPERQVNFRNLWFVKSKGKELHPALDGLANWPLRGLFWLSKDIFEDDFRNVTEPDAQALYELRNHMEHKFVSAHDSLLRAISPRTPESPKAGVFDISVDDLIAKTLRQLKLARAAIIYLSLGVHAKERRHAKEHGTDKLTLPMILDTWDDGWKRQD
jgi:tetratricopeptide (TPR) repeat protein